MSNLFIKYLQKQVSLDVFNRSNEFQEIHPRKPLDYQQQIDLYKKYTELKKHPQITQSQEFNRRISVVIEKTGARAKSPTTINQPPSEKTLSNTEKAPSTMTANIREDAKKPEKSQSTTNIEKESTKHGSLFTLHRDKKETSKSSRAMSQSPQRSNQERPTSSNKTDSEKKPKNGLIKRLSLRFKSMSMDHADLDDHEAKKSSSKKTKRNDSVKKSKEDVYSQNYAHHINKEKQKKSTENLYTTHRWNMENASKPSAPSEYSDYEMIKVRLENQQAGGNEIDIKSNIYKKRRKYFTKKKLFTFLELRLFFW